MTPAADLVSLLSDLPSISTLEYYLTIGSTNDRARELAAQGTPEIALIAADAQVAGRGRLGRAWYTPPGTALAFSLLTRPAITAQRTLRLTMLAGLAVVEGIESATGLRLDLRWPNDVVAMNNDMLDSVSPGISQRPLTVRKVGGILTECAFQGDDVEYAVIGIGLNVNVDFSQQAELRESAASLRQLAGHEIDRWAVLKAVAAAWIERSAWLAVDDRLRAAWAARLINLQQNLRVNLNGQVVEGYAEGVDEDGALLLRTQGQVWRLLAGDVTLHELNR